MIIVFNIKRGVSLFSKSGVELKLTSHLLDVPEPCEALTFTISRLSNTSSLSLFVAVAVHAMNGVRAGTRARNSASRLYAGRKSLLLLVVVNIPHSELHPHVQQQHTCTLSENPGFSRASFHLSSMRASGEQKTKLAE